MVMFVDKPIEETEAIASGENTRVLPIIYLAVLPGLETSGAVFSLLPVSAGSW